MALGDEADMKAAENEVGSKVVASEVPVGHDASVGLEKASD